MEQRFNIPVFGVLHSFRVLMGLRICVLFGLSALLVNAQTNKPAEPSPQPPSESIIEQIKKAVVFLQGSYIVVQPRDFQVFKQWVPTLASLSGTGFLIFMPDSRLGPSNGIAYLVTNKHMIREPGPNGSLGEGPYFSSISMRINTKQSLSDGTQLALITLPVVDAEGNLGWLVDSDEGVDLAIIPVGLDIRALDYKTLQQDLFATKEVLAKEQVSENDEILFAGLFAWSPGLKKNLPIIRHGKLARLLEERIPLDRTHPEKPVEVHLAEVMSFGGNSGSPVFLRLGGVREGTTATAFSGYRYYLLGVMQGFFPEGVDFAVEVAELRGTTRQNSGLAAVIPTDKIMEVLDGPRGRAFRDSYVASFYSGQGNFVESEKLYKEAIEILEKSSPLHSDLAAALRAYASLLRRINRAQEATPLESRAQQILSNVTTDLIHPRN